MLTDFLLIMTLTLYIVLVYVTGWAEAKIKRLEARISKLEKSAMQARILERQDSPYAPQFLECGFKWCHKDQRWEKTAQDANRARKEIEKVEDTIMTDTGSYPHNLKTDIR